jgi:hypothetical protein
MIPINGLGKVDLAGIWFALSSPDPAIAIPASENLLGLVYTGQPNQIEELIADRY